MRSYDKAEMLKSAIKHLYSNEGHSISYISKLLEINRKTLSSKIIEWKLSEPEPRHHFTPSMKKFVNKNRQLIKSRLDSDIPITKIADEINISRHSLVKTIIPNDAILKRHMKIILIVKKLITITEYNLLRNSLFLSMILMIYPMNYGIQFWDTKGIWFQIWVVLNIIQADTKHITWLKILLIRIMAGYI